MNETAIKSVLPSFQWQAELVGDHWAVSTEPSVLADTNEHLLIVDVPVNGPAPRTCHESMYSFLGVTPRPPAPRGPCKPSDISESDAQMLALDTFEPDRSAGLMAERARSERTAWIVPIRIAGRPASDRDADKGLFRVFKRNANVLNIGTGEYFTALRSKAQFVRHHCLEDKR